MSWCEKVTFDEMMMTSYLHRTNGLSWILKC